ncbi:MAG TPA: hypothetical protein VF175_08510, partial [Lacipirellula sp.]
VAPDRAPTVQIIDPAQDLAVLPEAKIDIAINAEDDLAVQAVSLGVAPVSQPDQAPARIELDKGGEQPERGPQAITYALELSSLAPPAGTELQVVAHASDYAGQETIGVRPLRLRIISRDEFLRRVDGLTKRLTTTLERSLAIERESRTRVGQLLGEPTASYGSGIASAASLQRQVGQTLAGSPASAVQLAEGLAEEYRRNRWPDEHALGHIESVRVILNNLVTGPLAAAEETLTNVTRAAQSSADREGLRDKHREALLDVRTRQDEVLVALAALIRDLAQVSEIQQFQRDLAELKRGQAELLSETEALARAALLNTDELTSQQRLARQQAVGRQRQLAGSLAATLGRMKQSSASLAASKSTDALRLQAALAAAEQSQLQGRIREAADQLAAARFGQATSAQRAVVEHLQQALDQMAEGGDRAAMDRLAALKSAERRLDAIREAVNSLPAEPAPRATAELAQQTRQLAEDLEQIRADAAAQSARTAAERLTGEASPESQRSARQTLEDAQRQLAAERRRHEALLSKLKADRRDALRAAAVQQAPIDQAAPKRGAKPGKSSAATVATTAPVDRAAVSKLVKDLWGRLPERQREELLQPLSEEFLPEYAEEIEEYFRVLAETAADGDGEENQP